MTIDITKIKPGDRLAVWVEVCTDQNPYGPLYVKSPGGVAFSVRPESIALHEPGPLAVGDRVQSTSTKHRGTVVGVCGNTAWFLREDGSRDKPYTVSAHDLERIP